MGDKQSLRLDKYNSQFSGQTVLYAYIHENERRVYIALFNFSLKF